MNFKSIGIPTIKLLVIAAVITILLFLTNNTTEAKIAQNQADANVASRKEVLPDADDFDEKTVTVDGVEYTYYEAKNGAGYVFSGSNKGYGGAVVESDAQDHKNDIYRLSPGIENNAGRKQYNVFVLKRKY